MTRFRSMRVLATLLAAAFALASPLGGASHGGSHIATYVAGTTAFVAEIGCQTLVSGVTACAVAGGLVCDVYVGDQPVTPGVGGACPPVLVQSGAIVTASVNDFLFGQALSWAVCIDGDGNAVCRPETPADTIVISTCAQSQGALNVLNSGSAGYLSIFIMTEANPSLGPNSMCGATAGTITWDVTQYPPECSDLQDNDGNGFTDYPSDPGCASATDDSERLPPPPARGH